MCKYVVVALILLPLVVLYCLGLNCLNKCKDIKDINLCFVKL